MREQLEITGEVSEFKEDNYELFFRENAVYFIHTSNTEVTRNAILIEAEGGFFLVSLHHPNGEALEGIGQRFYPMLETLVVTSK